MLKPMKAKAAPKKKYNDFGVEITAADEARMKADEARHRAGRTAAAAAPPPKYSATDKQKAAFIAKQNKSDAAVNAAAKKSLKGRKRGLDELLKHF